MLEASCIAPINIALIKYWGKLSFVKLGEYADPCSIVDQSNLKYLNLPANSSLSATLSTDALYSKTSIVASPELSEDVFYLNGKISTLTQRHLRVIELMRKLCEIPEEISKLKLFIVSENSVPTGSGLASSASGLAALTLCLAKLYGMLPRIENNADFSNESLVHHRYFHIPEKFYSKLQFLSTIARQGSGSASRSLFPNFVIWDKPDIENINDLDKLSLSSSASPLSDQNKSFNQDIRILILIVSDKEKSTGSTAGMELASSSPLYLHRILNEAPSSLLLLIKYIRLGSFPEFAKIVIQDSDSMHRVMQTSTPPLNYLTKTSKDIVAVVSDKINGSSNIKVAYSFDAGPNPVLFTLKQYEQDVIRAITKDFDGKIIYSKLGEGPLISDKADLIQFDAETKQIKIKS